MTGIRHVGRQTVLENEVRETIVERTGDHVVTIVGAAESGLVRGVLAGEIPETIDHEADRTTMMAKRHQDVPRGTATTDT